MSNRVVLIRNAARYDFGGGERFPVFLAEELISNDYEPTIITRSPALRSFCRERGIATIRGWWWSRQNWSGWCVALLPIYITWQLILFCWYVSVFINMRPRVVHIQSKDDFIAATYAARLAGARVIWTDHADLKHIWLSLTRPLKNPIGKLVYLAAHLAHTITLVSASEQREVSAHLSDKSRIHHKLRVIHNGCLDQAASYPHIPSDIFTFCSINRLVTDKGMGEMITAFQKFHVAHPNSQLLVVGDGPEAEIFKSQAGGDESIVFLGYQSDPLTYVAQADVFLQPTYHEGFSVALVEATMLARTIIATNVGGNPEIITDRQTGLLIPARDSDALLAAMKELHLDSELRYRLGHAARDRYLSEFQFDQIVKERFLPLYENTRN